MKMLQAKQGSVDDPFGRLGGSSMAKLKNMDSEKERARKRPRSPTHEEIMSKIKTRQKENEQNKIKEERANKKGLNAAIEHALKQRVPPSALEDLSFGNTKISTGMLKSQDPSS